MAFRRIKKSSVEIKMSLELQVLDIRSSHLNNSEDEKTSIVEIFGISRLPDGHYESCVLLVEGFQHYVHFPVSATFTEQDVNRLQILLEAHLSERHGPSDGKRVNVRAVRRQLMPLLYYRLEDRYQHFLRVDLSVFTSSSLDILPSFDRTLHISL